MDTLELITRVAAIVFGCGVLITLGIAAYRLGEVAKQLQRWLDETDPAEPPLPPLPDPHPAEEPKP